MGKNKRSCGTKYENIAAEYLIGKGYQILEKNFRCRSGEIDLIARKDSSIIFIEVKYRRNARHGDPKESVHYRKQLVISRVASYYLLKSGHGFTSPCRFDVIAILGDESQIQHIQNAFEYRGPNGNI
ncbi:MAG: YraN family protein [Lachnospiraceae bacterium]